MRLIRDSAQDKLDRLLLDEASDRASLLTSSRGRDPRRSNSGFVSRKCWFSTRRVSDEVNGRKWSTPFDLPVPSALLDTLLPELNS